MAARLQILPPAGPLGNILLHLGYVVVGYTSERHDPFFPSPSEVKPNKILASIIQRHWLKISERTFFLSGSKPTDEF
jgi:hypothetical protein